MKRVTESYVPFTITKLKASYIIGDYKREWLNNNIICFYFIEKIWIKDENVVRNSKSWIYRKSNVSIPRIYKSSIKNQFHKEK